MQIPHTQIHTHTDAEWARERKRVRHFVYLKDYHVCVCVCVFKCVTDK